MRSKTSFFNAAIFKKDLSRFYLLALLYLALQCVLLPLALQVELGGMHDASYDELMLRAVKYVYSSTSLTALTAFFGAPCAALAVYSYLYSARSANMMCSLPVRREAMFLSHAAAVFAVVLASNLVAVLLTLAVTLPAGLMLGGYLAQWFVITLGQFVLFFGIAVLCAVVTGNILAMPAIYLVVNLAAFAFAAAISNSLNSVLYGVNVSDAFEGVIRFSPVIWFQLGPTYSYVEGYDPLNPSHTDIFYTYGTDLAVYALVGIVFIAAAFLIYRARRMETAGDVVSITCLRPVFKLVFALGVGIVGGYVFFSMFFSYGYGGDPAYRLMGCLALFSVIGYIGGDMLVRRSTRIRSLRSVLPGIAIAAVLAAGIWAADADVFGAERYVPDPAEVESAYVTVGGQQVTLTDAEGIGWVTAAHQSILDNREMNEYRNDSDYTYDYYCNIVYELADGREVRRNYDVAASPTPGEMLPETEILDRLMNSPEGILSRKELYEGDSVDTISSGYVRYTDANGDSVSLDFTAADMRELYTECIVPDMRDGTIGLYSFSSDVNYEFYDCEIELYFFDQPDGNISSGYVETADASIEGGAHQGFYTYATPNSERTNAWLAEHGVALDTLAELYKYVG